MLMSLQIVYKEQIMPKLKEELGVKSVMSVPRLVKIVVDMGIGEAADNREILDRAREDLALITGQRPEIRGARRAIAGFVTRRGSPIGLRVTLRGKRMYGFLEKLVRIVLPRIRDFRGVRVSSFDGKGNYTLGVEEYVVFPEVDVAKAGKSRGLGITIVTTAKSNESAKRLLEELGMPFEKNSKHEARNPKQIKISKSQ
ncbi:50S ribosomal protein L5 [Candidatus Microgenomates bacterium]|nr:50S ribosomal protein L5 [Candidatus Microgenomates bacterium]